MPNDQTTNRVCQLSRDQMGQGPTEPHTERSTFLLSSVLLVLLVVQGAGTTEGPMVRGRLRLRTRFPARREWHVCS